MTAIILSALFICLAGFSKAVADTLTHHFETSVFKNKDRRFWDPAISWKYARYLKFTRYKIDAWHLANSGMIISFCTAVATNCIHDHLHWLLRLIIAGTLFNLSFNLFYNKLLRK
jgi:hypothetical protein